MTVPCNVDLRFVLQVEIWTAGDEAVIRVWNMDLTELRRLSGHTTCIRSMMATAASRLVISGDVDGKIILWECKSYTRLQEIKITLTPVFALAATTDRYAAVLGSGCVLIADSFWVGADKHVIEFRKGLPFPTKRTAPSTPDATTTRLTRVTLGHSRRFQVPKTSEETLLGFSPPHFQSAVQIIDPSESSVSGTLPAGAVYGVGAYWQAHSRPISCMLYLPNRSELWTGGQDGVIAVWRDSEDVRQSVLSLPSLQAALSFAGEDSEFVSARACCSDSRVEREGVLLKFSHGRQIYSVRICGHARLPLERRPVGLFNLCWMESSEY